jgi:hypothetical protein
MEKKTQSHKNPMNIFKMVALICILWSFSICNDLVIREILFKKELMCKHANNHVQALPQPIMLFFFMNARVEKKCLFFIDPLKQLLLQPIHKLA